MSDKEPKLEPKVEREIEEAGIEATARAITRRLGPDGMETVIQNAFVIEALRAQRLAGQADVDKAAPLLRSKLSKAQKVVEAAREVPRRQARGPADRSRRDRAIAALHAALAAYEAEK